MSNDMFMSSIVMYAAMNEARNKLSTMPRNVVPSLDPFIAGAASMLERWASEHKIEFTEEYVAKTVETLKKYYPLKYEALVTGFVEALALSDEIGEFLEF